MLHNWTKFCEGGGKIFTFADALTHPFTFCRLLELRITIRLLPVNAKIVAQSSVDVKPPRSTCEASCAPRQPKIGNVAKSGMDVRGVGLSQTDKTTRSIAHAVEVAPLYSHSGGLGQPATPYVFFPPSQTLPHYPKISAHHTNHGNPASSSLAAIQCVRGKQLRISKCQALIAHVLSLTPNS